MRNGQRGQVFLLVLIFLAIGSMLAIPALRLTSTSLVSSRVVTQQTRRLYAADAAQEYVMWRMLHKGWTNDFQSNGSTGYASIELCGVSVNITVVMKATEGKGGVILATNDSIQPTKTVSPNQTDGSYTTYTYIIRLEQLSSNNTAGLDKVYDILPPRFGVGDYVSGSTQIRIDGGAWQSFHDPVVEDSGSASWGGQVRLTWPNPAYYGSANFTSPFRDFDVRQVKEIEFQVAGSLLNNRTYYNWVVIHSQDVVSLSGPTAIIKTGTGAAPVGGLITVSKESEPEVILPGVETDINYTVVIKSLDSSTRHIGSVVDYLPPGFEYVGPTSNMTTDEPVAENVTLNGVDRLKLTWSFSPSVNLAGGATNYLQFVARATKDVSGSYYNEVEVLLDETSFPKIFADSGVTLSDLYSTYSWTTGTVIVPAYDSSANASNMIIDANLALSLGSMTITSYQIR